MLRQRIIAEIPIYRMENGEESEYLVEGEVEIDWGRDDEYDAEIVRYRVIEESSCCGAKPRSAVRNRVARCSKCSEWAVFGPERPLKLTGLEEEKLIVTALGILK